MIDTNNSANPNEHSIIAEYTSTSTPALVNSNVYHINYDAPSQLLFISYASAGNGMTIISLNNSLNQSNHYVVGTYTTATTPRVLNNNVRSTYYDNVTDYVFVATSGGASIISLNGSLNQSNHYIVAEYTTSSSPPILRNSATAVSYDNIRDLLFVGAWRGGISVINLNATTNQSRHYLVAQYNETSSPNLPNVYFGREPLTYDQDNNIIYVHIGGQGTSGVIGGIRGISLNESLNQSRHYLIASYNQTSTVPFSGNTYDMAFDNDYLYIAGMEGIKVINRNGTLDSSDDTLIRSYNERTIPRTYESSITNMIIDNESDVLYIGNNYLHAIDLSNRRPASATYLLAPTNNSEVVFWQESSTSDHTITIESRGGGADAFWRDDFDQGNGSNVADTFGYGGFFNFVEVNETLTLSNATSIDWGWAWIDTGRADDFWPANSVVKVRSKFNSSTVEDPLYKVSDYTNTDNYESWGDVTIHNTVDWQTQDILSYSAFRYIMTYVEVNPWNNTATDLQYEINWTYVVAPDSAWTAWNNSCSSPPCALYNNSNYSQYRFTLNTTNELTTPKITSLTQGSFVSSALYVSDPISLASRESIQIYPNTTVPNGSSLSVEYSTDSGSSWSYATLNNYTSIGSATTLMWRANFSKGTSVFSPVLYSVSISSTAVAQATSTSSNSGGGGGRSGSGVAKGWQGITKNEPKDENIQAIIQKKAPVVKKDGVVIDNVFKLTSRPGITNGVVLGEIKLDNTKETIIELELPNEWLSPQQDLILVKEKPDGTQTINIITSTTLTTTIPANTTLLFYQREKEQPIIEQPTTQAETIEEKTELTPTQEQPPKQEPNDQPAKKSLLWPLVGLGILIIGLGSYWYSKH